MNPKIWKIGTTLSMIIIVIMTFPLHTTQAEEMLYASLGVNWDLAYLFEDNRIELTVTNLSPFSFEITQILINGEDFLDFSKKIETDEEWSFIQDYKIENNTEYIIQVYVKDSRFEPAYQDRYECIIGKNMLGYGTWGTRIVYIPNAFVPDSELENVFFGFTINSNYYTERYNQDYGNLAHLLFAPVLLDTIIDRDFPYMGYDYQYLGEETIDTPRARS